MRQLHKDGIQCQNVNIPCFNFHWEIWKTGKAAHWKSAVEEAIVCVGEFAMQHFIEKVIGAFAAPILSKSFLDDHFQKGGV